MPPQIDWGSKMRTWAWLSVVLVATAAWGQGYEASPQYDNPWMQPPVGPGREPARAGLAFGGHVGPYRVPGSSGPEAVPASRDVSYRLERSAFGQTFAGLRPDFLFGDIIAAPSGTDTNRPPAGITPSTAAFYVPSKQQVIAADNGPVRIDWRTVDGETNSRIYLVSAVPAKRPARLFWTEAPWNAPVVNLRDRHVTIHYNSRILAPLPVDFAAGTNINSVPTNKTVWVDAQGQLRAQGAAGFFVLEFFETGSKTKQIGIEIVEPLEPRVNTVPVTIGSRLLPVSAVYGMEELGAQVTRGLPGLVYQHSAPNGRGHFHNWLFATARTASTPWEIEVYWKQRGVTGVEWPFEADWYAAEWPEDRASAVYVRGGDATNATVNIPDSLRGALETYQDPPRHAFMSSDGKAFWTTGPGYSLLRLSAGDDVWFQVVRSVANTNNLVFNRAPVPWMIGEELRPVIRPAVAAFGGGTGYFALPAEAAPATIEVWARPAVNKSMAVFKLAGGVAANYALDFMHVGINAAGQWECFAAASGGKATILGPAVVAGQWSHLAVIADSAAGKVRFAVNGVAQGADIATDFAGWPTSVQSYLFGYPDQDEHNYVGFQGELRELRVWRRALSLEAIVANLGQELDGAELGLAHYFDFRERQTVGNGGLIWDRATLEWVTWNGVTGVPVAPPLRLSQPIAFDGRTGYFVVPASRLGLTIDAWIKPGRTTNATVMALLNPTTGGSQRQDLGLDASGRLRHRVLASAASENQGTTVLESGLWYHVAVVFENPGKLRLYVNGEQEGTEATAAAFSAEGLAYAFGRSSGLADGGYFSGEMQEVRMWDRVLSAEQVRALRFETAQGVEPGLLHAISFQDVYLRAGGGLALRDLVQEQTAEWYGTAVPGASAVEPLDQGSYSTGYIDQRAGTCFNVNLYPGTAGPSHIFAVNTNLLEVWWSQPRQQLYMPDPLEFPALVVRYTNVWPVFAPTLVLAGQSTDRTGLLPDSYGNPKVYYQNDPAQPGYNPNEEHALLIAGQVYALRDDLNAATSSQPWVLVEYADQEQGGAPAMQVFRVVETNEVYRFEQSLVAGTLLQPPMPLTVMPRCTLSTNTGGPAWRDRKLGWWAYAANADGSPAQIQMRYYYRMQEGFNFPARDLAHQPALGTEVPWLSREANPAAGTPVRYVYNIVWPDQVPVLRVGETLVKPKNGLPAVAGQKSVLILYQQSIALQEGARNVNENPYFYMGTMGGERISFSVTLIDPTRERVLGMTQLPEDVEVDMQAGKKYFTLLPPHLRNRLYYHMDSKQLRLMGQFVEPAAGEYYLLLNTLSASDRATVAGLSGSATWPTALAGLAPTLVEIVSDTQPFDSLALSAGVAREVGYVTLAFNSSTSLTEPADPISLEIIRVEAPLYQGEVKAIYSDNPLDEKLTMRHSGDFAGHPEWYQFDWRYLPPAPDGRPDPAPRETWLSFAGIRPDQLSVVIAGPGLLTLSDNYFVCRYRPLNTGGPTGDAWSEWTGPMLAEGWIKRALNGINPFEQRIKNLQDNQVNTTVSMISQAGARWVGNIPLNLQNINDYGLVEIYETILKRGRKLSIDANFSYGPANDALLLAAGRIHDLYMILGNEAYADAQDPTVAFSTRDRAVYGAATSSLFCFMNQVPNVLEEELALLRGRDDHLLPSVHTYPFYNRLIWNFTKGMDGGEAAYAVNYNVRNENGDASGVINEEDARRLYPQGHGDAWGHYLSAIKGYYQLLANTNFTWFPRIEGKVIGGVTVNVDYYDERKFAEAAAGRARTGAEIISLTHRSQYVEGISGLPTGLRDSNTNRAWGLTEWGSRVGQAALFDWVVGNSLLPDADGDPAHEGIQRIDRTTVPQLREITTALDQVQANLDHADLGLSPVGLAKDVVPFDINPEDIDAGKTHFEQIYERALIALNNANLALTHAQDYTLAIRHQTDSLADLKQAIEDGEGDFDNRLIEIFGYPYSDDIGPGKLYPQGYEGPDFYHYNYIDVHDFLGEPLAVRDVAVAVTNYLGTFYPKTDFLGAMAAALTWFPDWSISLSNKWTTNVTFRFSEQGFQLKPAEFTGARQAEGSLQSAYRDYLKSWYEFRGAVKGLQTLQSSIQDGYDRMVLQIARLKDQDTLMSWSAGVLSTLGIVENIAKEVYDGIEASKEISASFSEAMLVSVPESVIAGLAAGGDVAFAARGGIKVTEASLKTGQIIAKVVAKGIEYAAKISQKLVEGLRDTSMRRSDYDNQVRASWMDLLGKTRDQEAKLLDIQKAVQTLYQAEAQYRRLIVQAERLLAERTGFRAKAASQIQADRYGDMAFRIFRSDSIGKYRAAFDLAARYSALAAKAYDYETSLPQSDTPVLGGSDFLSAINRARSLGTILDGAPQPAGGSGDPGLADALARMKANWDVLKGRLSFNNPARESSRFSLRAELFRIGSPTNELERSRSDETWRQALLRARVNNLLEVPEFARYCLPFNPVRQAEPALVFRFATTIESGKNFFGWEMAGGDNAYDSSHFATKIRSVGVWFQNFNNAFASGLANEPRVYLIPAGTDIQRAPGAGLDLRRTWKVMDQALPVPFDVGQGLLSSPDWIPLIGSLSGGFGTLRKYPSLRAYHDSGQFDPSEVATNARLVGRSVWNTQWVLIIPASTLHADPAAALDWFIQGVHGDGGVSDILILFQTYSYAGN